MKKYLLFLMIFLYMGTTMGVTLHLHYCMGELIEWEASKTDNGHCENCGMTKKQSDKEDCCKKEVKKLKTDDSRKLSEERFVTPFLAAAIVHEPVNYRFVPTLYSNSRNVIYRSNAPPRSNPVPVYILNCTYLI